MTPPEETVQGNAREIASDLPVAVMQGFRDDYLLPEYTTFFNDIAPNNGFGQFGSFLFDDLTNPFQYTSPSQPSTSQIPYGTVQQQLDSIPDVLAGLIQDTSPPLLAEPAAAQSASQTSSATLIGTGQHNNSDTTRCKAGATSHGTSGQGIGDIDPKRSESEMRHRPLSPKVQSVTSRASDKSSATGSPLEDHLAEHFLEAMATAAIMREEETHPNYYHAVSDSEL